MKKSSSIPRILSNVNFSGIAKKSLEIANPITDLRYLDLVYKCSYLGSVRLAVCQCGVNAHFVEYIGWKSLCGADVCISSSLLLIFNISFVFIYCSIAVRYWSLLFLFVSVRKGCAEDTTITAERGLRTRGQLKQCLCILHHRLRTLDQTQNNFALNQKNWNT